MGVPGYTPGYLRRWCPKVGQGFASPVPFKALYHVMLKEFNCSQRKRRLKEKIKSGTGGVPPSVAAIACERAGGRPNPSGLTCPGTLGSIGPQGPRALGLQAPRGLGLGAPGHVNPGGFGGPCCIH